MLEYRVTDKQAVYLEEVDEGYAVDAPSATCVFSREFLVVLVVTKLAVGVASDLEQGVRRVCFLVEPENQHCNNATRNG